MFAHVFICVRSCVHLCSLMCSFVFAHVFICVRSCVHLCSLMFAHVFAHVFICVRSCVRSCSWAALVFALCSELPSPGAGPYPAPTTSEKSKLKKCLLQVSI